MLDDLQIILDRREFLCHNVPTPCPRCGEQMQIQLMSMDVPAKWRCRTCKHWFEREPSANEQSGEWSGYTEVHLIPGSGSNE